MILDHRSHTAMEHRDSWRTDPRMAAGLFEVLRPCSIDGCASDENHLLPEYFTRQDNCLQLDWKGEAKRRGVQPAVYVNPPYSKEDLRAKSPHNGMANFFKKAREEAERGVYSQWFFRARPGEGWFPWLLASRVWFIVGRVGFVSSETLMIDDQQTENHCVAEFIPGEFPFMATGMALNRDDVISAGQKAIYSNKYPVITARYEQIMS
ncbi:hypothetical protein AN237_26085 (plasmid) [Raoultella ornithinolytica]|uniref:DNA N-6-adenine-methyltransferase n=1 Tax=Raoultella ornithinolytica TaxID=54291 RepID=UPI00084A1A43|nr:DNA N-6-adenine-methyltransferase [Raoultella ornithinolytica]AOO60026.1 hypothetical protein AN237_26085 [Raoultella ornithinolytica]